MTRRQHRILLAGLLLVSALPVLAERKPVSITSVTFDRTDAGARMCNRLLERIEDPQRQFEPESVRPHLLVRQSTAAPSRSSLR